MNRAWAEPAVEVALVPARDMASLPERSSQWDDWGGPPTGETTSLGRLFVQADGELVGDVSWHATHYGPTAGSKAINIGISLAPAARGRGIGSRAQRLLAEHLFATTEVTRVEASTDIENIGEQRALEKAGFTREGVIRSAQARADGLHDLVGYSILRTDVASHAPGSPGQT